MKIVDFWKKYVKTIKNETQKNFVFIIERFDIAKLYEKFRDLILNTIIKNINNKKIKSNKRKKQKILSKRDFDIDDFDHSLYNSSSSKKTRVLNSIEFEILHENTRSFSFVWKSFSTTNFNSMKFQIFINIDAFIIIFFDNKIINFDLIVKNDNSQFAKKNLFYVKFLSILQKYKLWFSKRDDFENNSKFKLSLINVDDKSINVFNDKFL